VGGRTVVGLCPKPENQESRMYTLIAVIGFLFGGPGGLVLGVLILFLIEFIADAMSDTH